MELLPVGAIRAVVNSIRHNMDAQYGLIALFHMNKVDGFDCPGCAWPDPKHTSSFDVCENGAKAVSWEATEKRADAEFFKTNTVSELLGWEPQYSNSLLGLQRLLNMTPLLISIYPLNGK